MEELLERLQKCITGQTDPCGHNIPDIPTDTPPVPNGFDWDLWLGPEAQRPYHPNYTHMVFRGWYDFGGGSMADMGHYSLWTVFNALQLTSPMVVEPNLSHVCGMKDPVPYQIQQFFIPDGKLSAI